MKLANFRAFSVALLLSMVLGLTACGDSSDDFEPTQSSNNPSEPSPGGTEPGEQSNNPSEPSPGGTEPGEQVDTNNNTVPEGVVGPLDAVQTPLHEQVFGQLTGALAGTPLEGTLDCAGQAVVIDLIDVLDSIALALMVAAEAQDPGAALESGAENIQFSLGELAKDLPGALTALAGDDCNGGEGDDGEEGEGSDNPLAGTPLAPLGDALAPVLAQFPSGGDDANDLDLLSLSAVVTQLANAFHTGVQQIPAEAQDAPIFGGLLTTLDTALMDLDITMSHLGAYEGEAAAQDLENTLNHLLVNVLTEVVPVKFFEEQADQQGLISGPITDGVNQLTMALGDNLLDAALPPLSDALDDQLNILLDPIENQVLPAILGPIADGIAQFAGLIGGGGSGGGSGGPTGTPLDLILGPLTDALTGGAGGGSGGPTGTPLDLLLSPLLGAAGGGCPFEGTPLSPACAIFDAAPF